MGVHDSMGVHGWTATRTVATISLVLQIPAGNHEFAGSQPICLLSHLKSTCQVPAGLQRNEWGLAVPTWYLDLPLSQVSSLSRQQFFPTGPASLFLFPFFQRRSLLICCAVILSFVALLLLLFFFSFFFSFYAQFCANTRQFLTSLPRSLSDTRKHCH